MTYAETRIAEIMAQTGNREFAAHKAGVSYSAGAVDKAMGRPAVQEEVRRQQQAILFNKALPAAVKCLISIIEDEKAPTGSRVNASKVVLDRTLGSADEGDRKEPHEMTASEIAEHIAKLEAVAFERAKTIESAPVVPNEDDIFQ